ncbi:hypothetical protein [Saccharopolyspora phatthalungensis]|uniref:hypothetical protein n=1 Tax=Saccharopolyspora phatthalungensis TaxID=664693 RepID=UPI001C88A671|nr:hypothetical protein [Saccharopolyspora phatthalungensis]
MHNSQPWRWKLAAHSLHLYLERSWLLQVLDPTGRELVISCGAVLHHERIAFATEDGGPRCTGCRTRRRRIIWRGWSSAGSLRSTPTRSRWRVWQRLGGTDRMP